MQKKHVVMILATLLVGVLWAPTVGQASHKVTKTIPAKYCGTFYRYDGKKHGKKQWDELIIKHKSVKMMSPDFHPKKPFKLTPNAKSAAHRLRFKVIGKDKKQIFFVVDADLSQSYKSPIPENGLSLATRKIKHHKYRVVRGFQGGYWFDYIKGHKMAHDYYGQANGKY